jgi:Protein of unknown function, DUF547
VNSEDNRKRIILALVAFVLAAITARAETGNNVDVRAGIDHDEFDRLLKKYVNDQGLVNYGAWKQSATDVAALDNYLKKFAAKIDNGAGGSRGTSTGKPERVVERSEAINPASGNEKAASLVNAYNAFVLHWILSNYPIESIWQLKDSFSGKRNEIGGRDVALDDIEHGTLRPLIGYRAHAVLVCAARSCPPLQRFAYRADQFEGQNDRAYHVWLAREDLNKFSPAERKIEISSIFKWFKQDFDQAGGIPKILGRYAPPSVREFAASGKYDIRYLPYNWGLNDQGSHGRNYSRAQLLFDNILK